MKKQMFSLMLSAAIFTTSPLFAMDLPEEERNGVGILSVLPKNMIISTITTLPMQDVCSVSIVSKTMRKLSQDNEVWNPFAVTLGVKIDPKSHIYSQLQHYYQNLFSDLNTNYLTSMITLQSFRKNPIPGSNPVAYDIKLGARSLCMTYLQAHDIGTGTHENYLNTDFSQFDNDALVVFSKKPNEMCFQAQFTLFPSGGGVVDDYGTFMFSPEYNARLNSCAAKFPGILNGGMMGCTFTVKKIEK